MGQRPMRERQCRFLSEITISKPFWTISGREGDDDDKDKNGTESGSGSEGGDGTGSDTGTGGDGTGTGTESAAQTVSLAEFERLKARMQEADRNRTAAEARVKEFEDKDRSELERAQNDLKDAKEMQKRLEGALNKSRIENKFLASNKHTWHDPETALALLDMEGVEVGDDGKVTGLEDAIEKLAKAKPFLIKDGDGKDDKDKDKNKNGKDGKNGGRPSGQQPPANGSNGERTTERARLEEKYPQLKQQR